MVGRERPALRIPSKLKAQQAANDPFKRPELAVAIDKRKEQQVQMLEQQMIEDEINNEKNYFARLAKSTTYTAKEYGNSVSSFLSSTYNVLSNAAQTVKETMRQRNERIAAETRAEGTTDGAEAASHGPPSGGPVEGLTSSMGSRTGSMILGTPKMPSTPLTGKLPSGFSLSRNASMGYSAPHVTTPTLPSRNTSVVPTTNIVGGPESKTASPPSTRLNPRQFPANATPAANRAPAVPLPADGTSPSITYNFYYLNSKRPDEAAATQAQLGYDPVYGRAAATRSSGGRASLQLPASPAWRPRVHLSARKPSGPRRTEPIEDTGSRPPAPPLAMPNFDSAVPKRLRGESPEGLMDTPRDEGRHEPLMKNPFTTADGGVNPFSAAGDIGMSPTPVKNAPPPPPAEKASKFNFASAQSEKPVNSGATKSSDSKPSDPFAAATSSGAASNPFASSSGSSNPFSAGSSKPSGDSAAPKPAAPAMTTNSFVQPGPVNVAFDDDSFAPGADSDDDDKGHSKVDSKGPSGNPFAGSSSSSKPSGGMFDFGAKSAEKTETPSTSTSNPFGATSSSGNSKPSDPFAATSSSSKPFASSASSNPFSAGSSKPSGDSAAPKPAAAPAPAMTTNSFVQPGPVNVAFDDDSFAPGADSDDDDKGDSKVDSTRPSGNPFAGSSSSSKPSGGMFDFGAKSAEKTETPSTSTSNPFGSGATPTSSGAASNPFASSSGSSNPFSAGSSKPSGDSAAAKPAAPAMTTNSFVQPGPVNVAFDDDSFAPGADSDDDDKGDSKVDSTRPSGNPFAGSSSSSKPSGGMFDFGAKSAEKTETPSTSTSNPFGSGATPTSSGAASNPFASSSGSSNPFSAGSSKPSGDSAAPKPAAPAMTTNSFVQPGPVNVAFDDDSFAPGADSDDDDKGDSKVDSTGPSGNPFAGSSSSSKPSGGMFDFGAKSAEKTETPSTSTSNPFSSGATKSGSSGSNPFASSTSASNPFAASTSAPLTSTVGAFGAAASSSPSAATGFGFGSTAGVVETPSKPADSAGFGFITPMAGLSADSSVNFDTIRK